MSTANSQGKKIILQSQKCCALRIIGRHWAKKDRRKWRGLAMLVLKADGWSETQIAHAFGVNRGHVNRAVQRVRSAVSAALEIERLPNENSPEGDPEADEL